MPTVLVIARDGVERHEETVRLLGREVTLIVQGVAGDTERAHSLVRSADGQVDALVLDGLPEKLQLGRVVRSHQLGERLRAAARRTVVVDGHGVRAALERWGVILADRREPGLFSRRHVLLLPGLNHGGMAQGLAAHSPHVRYADPVLYFGLPRAPGIGHRSTLDQAALATLRALRGQDFGELSHGPERPRGGRTLARLCGWADVLAGDAQAIRRHALPHVAGRTIVVEHADEETAGEFASAGAAIVVTLLPSLEGGDALARHSAAVLEGLLVALRPNPSEPPTEDTYLGLIADLEWSPAVRTLQAEDRAVNRFAFVIHPLEVGHIRKSPLFAWTKVLPDALVERVAGLMPPLCLSTIRGGRSPATGQRIEGYLYSLGATPRLMMSGGERSTYRKLVAAAAMAERRRARIMGLGAFTSVVGDAGMTVDREAGIAVTSGNSLTVAATLEAAKEAVQRMGVRDLSRGRAMIIGATGSIGAVCSRLLAQALRDVVLVSIEPERLIELKRRILAEAPGAAVAVATRPDEWLPDSDLVVTTTSAFGQRVLDISRCKPGAVICDVARPPDIAEAEATLRPDVLVIESGEVLIPGEIDFGYDIGLPPGTAYACLAETALLAMEGRFESFTLGRQLDMERVKEIYRLFKKHGFRLAPLRSFGRVLTEADFADKRSRAEALLEDPERLARLQAEVGEALAALSPAAKGVAHRRREPGARWEWLGLLLERLTGRISSASGRSPR